MRVRPGTAQGKAAFLCISAILSLSPIQMHLDLVPINRIQKIFDKVDGRNLSPLG